LFFFSPTANFPCLLWVVFHTIFCSTVTFLPVLPFLDIYLSGNYFSIFLYNSLLSRFAVYSPGLAYLFQLPVSCDSSVSIVTMIQLDDRRIDKTCILEALG
jgi:uncharacterized membrane protein